MQTAAQLKISVADYRVGEKSAALKHEYENSVACAMVGTSRDRYRLVNPAQKQQLAAGKRTFEPG